MPRAGLTARAVVDAGARMLDAGGEDALNLASLAQDLGVKPPSLYKHVDGMPGLRRGIMLRAKAEVTEALGRAAIGKAGDDAVRGLALAYRDWARAHPGQYPLTMRAPVPGDAEDDDVSSRLLGVVSTIVSGYGIETDDDLVDAVRFLRATLHGFVDLERMGAFRLPRDLERSFARAVDSITTSLAAWGRPPGRDFSRPLA